MVQALRTKRTVRGAVRTVRSRAVAALAVVLAMAMALAGCAGGESQSTQTASGGTDTSNYDPTSSAKPAVTNNGKTEQYKPAEGSATATLKIASGSENKEVSAAIQKAVDDSKVAVTIDYMGSLDIMKVLQAGGRSYDAVWPASSMWISMGDAKHVVKDANSTSTTPVVFGIAKSKAVKLGWADDSGKTKSVSTKDIIAAVKSKKLAFSMTSATQSNSGASAYLAFLTAMAGTDRAITASDLNNANVQANVQTLLSGVDRSSGSSDWLKDMVVANPNRFDAMVNYESLVIQADKALTAKGKDPLLAVYPSDGIAVSDSPLGYVDRGQKLDDAYGKFSDALHSKDSKLLFERAGRRTGLGGTLTNASDDKVKQSFRGEWGINTSAETLKTIPMPSADVISRSLNVYQTMLRKPSWTVWVVDYSGSMYGAGKEGVVRGLNAALNPSQARQARIEPGAKDVNILIPFSSEANVAAKTTGSNTAELLSQGSATETLGGTDIYKGLELALQNMPSDTSAYTTAIVLMTDGQSQTGEKNAFTQQYRANDKDIPIFSIMFGDADPSQLNELASLSNAKVFDGRSEDLASVFREVKGFN
ncbi:von Willebrand factor type A (vWA) domain-containing protein [Bifidobacterium margollesii]|uniref:von Willebrand factor type A (VWA) domain-containing protein n=1 Tax=Bifidobacterium margollesii TaxID=2020964 RepID=A0A2N5J7D2_9BIFI|nr:VWA domain-containing protein [Bifidobacterium margollesii]PLS30120.1 von Willebrand factor type A (vWA) domain-containing protein [Bifidobacterium margollesii]